MAQYDGQAVIPLERVCKDYFAPMTTETLMRKISRGEIALPLTRMEKSQKGFRGVHISDLAAYIDARREQAQKEMVQLRGF